MVKKIIDALTYGSNKLKGSNIESYLTDARVLLCHILGCDRGFLTVHSNDEIDQKDFLKYTGLIEKRARHTPVKYLTGICEFYSLDFWVNENVLIPRPDTEIIIDKALKEIKKESKIKILDLCSGSGCIGITLATVFKNSLVTMVEISDGAIKVSKRNISKHKLENRVNIIKKDILAEEMEGNFDLIVSNPPYISEEEFLTLSEDIKNYEPKLALVSPVDEYRFYKRIIDVYSSNLSSNGIMLLEMGYNQSKYLCNYVKEKNIFTSYETVKDLAGIERVLCLKKQ